MNRKVLIIQTGDAYEELVQKDMNFDDMIIGRIKTKNYKVVKPYKGEELPDYKEVDRIIISGAHSMVTDGDEWINNLSKWLLGIKDKSIPLLGICYGHQLLAQIFNGIASYHPKGSEIGMKEIKLTNCGEKDKLFKGIESTFYGYTTHSQSVIELPKDAVVLAYNSFEPNHSFRIGEYIYGVQFHPEFTADIMKVYVRNQKEKIDSFEETYKNIKELNSGVKIFDNFMKL